MASLTVDYFDRVYTSSDDPWGFASRWYERRKYALTMAALPHERYRRAFEPGCSIGVLSEMLATRCDSLLSWEVVPRIARLAARRLAGNAGAEVHCDGIPGSWPDENFDLVVLSEVGYYLDAEDLDRTLDLVARSLDPGGHLVSVHYTGPSDYPLGGFDVQRCVSARPEFTPVCRLDDREFCLLVVERAGE